MGKEYSRLLSTEKEIEHFIENILDIDSRKQKRNAIKAILSEENNILVYKDQSTFKSQDYRDFACRSNEERAKLHTQILNDLLNKARLPNDEHIGLKKGGAKPLRSIKQEENLFYIIGAPASGKSKISNIIADIMGAYILDSDYAKRKLPEYKKIAGASLVHEESDNIVLSGTESLLAKCIKNKYNIVIPKIGHNLNGICMFIKEMKQKKYKSFLVSVDLDRKKATQRAYYRYTKTKRYVPLSLIFDSYANEPTLNYFKIKQQHFSLFDGYAQISTDVNKEESYKLIEQIGIDEFENIEWR